MPNCANRAIRAIRAIRVSVCLCVSSGGLWSLGLERGVLWHVIICFDTLETLLSCPQAYGQS